LKDWSMDGILRKSILRKCTGSRRASSIDVKDSSGYKKRGFPFRAVKMKRFLRYELVCHIAGAMLSMTEEKQLTTSNTFGMSAKCV
jgi:hypothetical protein